MTRSKFSATKAYFLAIVMFLMVGLIAEGIDPYYLCFIAFFIYALSIAYEVAKWEGGGELT